MIRSKIYILLVQILLVWLQNLVLAHILTWI